MQLAQNEFRVSSVLEAFERNPIQTTLLSTLKKMAIFKIWLPLQKKLGIYVAKRLSKLSSYPNFLEILLPQNQISSRISKKSSLSEVSISYKPDLMLVNKNSLSQSSLISKKILFFCPEKYGARPSFTFSQLIDSARRVSFQVYHVDFLKETLNGDEICLLFESSVKEIGPDIILFSSSDSYVIPSFKDFTPKFVASIKEKHVFSLINICGDLWRKVDQEVIEKWKSVCDVMLHADNAAIRYYSKEVRKKALYYPYHGLMPAAGEMERSANEIFFSGQVRDSDRRIILNRMIKDWRDARNFKLNLKVHYVWTDESAYSVDYYLQKLRESRFCVSFAQKGANHFLIPGRSLEAVAAGCILLHQESPEFRPLSEVLVPQEHYIPFEDYSDLNRILQSIENAPEKFFHIGGSARKFFSSRYSDVGLWFSINEKLKSTASDRD